MDGADEAEDVVAVDCLEVDVSLFKLAEEILALTNLSWMEVGLGLRIIGENGVCSSSNALLMLEELTPGEKMLVNKATSFSSPLLSGGCSNSALLLWLMSSAV